MTAIDTTNLRLSGVIAPPNGNIHGVWTAAMTNNNVAGNCYGGILSGATTLAGGYLLTIANTVMRSPFAAKITGLSAGTSYALDIAGYTASVSQGLEIFYGPTLGPIDFAITAA